MDWVKIKKRRLLSLVISFAMLLAMLPAGSITAFADSGTPSGSGTSGDPWQITTASQLDSFVRSHMDGHFKLMNDIDISGYASQTWSSDYHYDGWVPLGLDIYSNGTAFTGVFDGNGKTINGLTVKFINDGNSSGKIGLFSHIGGGTVKNLNITGLNLDAGSPGIFSYGGIAGYIDSGASVINCSVSGRIHNIGSGSDIGGITGKVTDGSIVNCHFEGGIDSGRFRTGGIAGGAVNSIVTGCSVKADVIYALGTNNSDTGGIIGNASGCTVSRCYAIVSTQVIANTSSGGLIGGTDSCTVSDCYAMAYVRGDQYVGGLIGFLGNTTVSRCYAAGNILGATQYKGALFGYTDTRNNVADCYFNSALSALGFSGSTGVAGLYSYQMTRQSTFSGWDFDTVWAINEGATYPYLRGNPSDPPPAPPHVVTVGGSFSVNDKHYDGTTSATIANNSLTLVGVNPGDTVVFNPVLAFADASIGSGKTVRIVDYTLTGDSSGLYSVVLTGAPTCTGNITSGGSGTAADPYLIGNAVELNNVRNNLNSGVYYRLENDIDLTSVCRSGGAFYHSGLGWTPIGDAANQFKGTFDGNGHTITGLYINSPSVNNIGLFSCVSTEGTVKNLILKDASVTGGATIAALAGYSGGTITGCAVVGSSSVSTAQITRGGLVGNNGGIISYCYAICSVTGSTGSANSGVLAGYSTGSISYCYAAGTVQGSPSTTGGLLGNKENGGTVTNCYYNSAVSGFSDTTKGTPLTSANMAKQASYAGWDFTTVWAINEGATYPYLRGNPPNPLPAPPHVVTVSGSFTVNDKQYDGTTSATIANNSLTLVGVNPGDTVVFNPVLTFADANIGSGKTVRIVDYTLTGDSSGLYSVVLTGAPTCTGNITKMTPATPAAPVVLLVTSTSVTLTAVTGAEYRMNGGAWQDSNVFTGLSPTTAYIFTQRIKATSTSNASPESAQTAVTTPLNGSGTAADPYRIVTAADLNYVRNNLNSGVCYRLENDIDLTSVCRSGGAFYHSGLGWTPIGDAANQFKGTFDGNGHTITGLYINFPSVNNIGLFSCVSAEGTIKNLILKDASVTGGATIADLAGYSAGTITGCAVVGSSSVFTTQITRGGIVGNNGGVISYCYAICSVTGSTGSANSGVLAGYSTGSISYCYAAGTVQGSSNTGGLLGNKANGGTVTNCYYNSAISGFSDTAKGTPLTSANMAKQASYADWNFTTVWAISEGVSYPYLRAAVPNPIPTPPTLTITGSFAVKNKAYDGTTAATISTSSLTLSGVASGDTVTLNPAAAFSSADVGNGKTVSLTAASTLSGASAGKYILSLSGAPVASANIAVAASGSGTQTDPYKITTPTELYNVRYGLNYYYVLQNDINLSGYSSGAGWVPIGSNAARFTGTLDGSGFAVAGLYISSGTLAYAGLFGYIGSGGVVQNLTLSGAGITTTTNTEGSYVGGIAGLNEGTIQSCTTAGTIRAGDAGATYDASYAQAGGICGLNSGLIYACSSSMSVNGRRNAGGIVGGNLKDVRQCFFTGSVGSLSGAASLNLGGLVGYNHEGSIYDSYCTGKITGTALYVGGVTGSSTSPVTDSYAACSITATASAASGGLIGSNTGTVTSCYYDRQVTGKSDTGKGTPLTTANMMKLASFFGWDFTNIWAVSENASYPYLRNAEDEPWDLISVSVTWGSMEFTYSDGTWNPQTHEYEGGGWTTTAENANKISVTSTSDVPVTVSYSYAPETGYSDVIGSFTDGTNPIASRNLPAGNTVPQSCDAFLELSRKPPEMSVSKIGSVTVTITVTD